MRSGTAATGRSLFQFSLNRLDDLVRFDNLILIFRHLQHLKTDYPKAVEVSFREVFRTNRRLLPAVATLSIECSHSRPVLSASFTWTRRNARPKLPSTQSKSFSNAWPTRSRTAALTESVVLAC